MQELKYWVEKAADQVSHDNSVIHERVLTHAQGELQSTGRLTIWQVKAVALQQEVLQLILCRHNPAHLEGKPQITEDEKTTGEWLIESSSALIKRWEW